MGILLSLFVIFLCCLVIWRACDGFEIGSEYIGRNMSEGVRGGTINAISSSLPELLTTMVALFYLQNTDGFSVGIGTTAGSALFNGMIIPAVCIFSVVGAVVMGKRVTSVNVSLRVLVRDGLFLIFCELVLILIINGTVLSWWQGLVLMLLYVGYFVYMIFGTRRVETSFDDEEDEDSDDESEPGVIAQLFYWISGGPLLDLERMFVGEKQRQLIREEKWNGWPLMLTSSAVIGLACWALVLACEWLGSGPGNTSHPNFHLLGHEFTGIGMQTMFVAVIFASMATSVPDTVMSIRDARDGDYDDAVANALGSNIFDICFALGFPLFLYTLIYGDIIVSPEIAKLSSELRFILLIMTVIGFFVYYIGPRITLENGTKCVRMRRRKAVLLIVLYVIFVAYVVARGQNAAWANQVATYVDWLLGWVPDFFSSNEV